MNSLKLGRAGVVRLFILALVFPVLFAACNRSESKTRNEANSNKAAETQSIAVTQDKAVARQIPSFIQATGSLVANETSNVAPKVRSL
jgi:hypothetical protein